MKLLLCVAIIFTISGCTSEISNNMIKKDIKPYSFQTIWNQISSDKLSTLPQNKVSYTKLSKNGHDTIKENAYRTLESQADILEPFDKLVHPNGICFKGIWKIDKENIYSGYFKKDSEALIIARASTALSNTTNDTKRAFGFAGKLFPTIEQDKVNIEHTANFFLIDDLGGTDALHYTDVVLTNEPNISFSYEIFKNLLYALKVTSVFNNADKHSGIRQLYEISQLGEKDNINIITPKWMKIEASKYEKNNHKDFRDELQIQQGAKLQFNISVANIEIDKKKNWIQIGTITLDTSVVSNSCDKRLHFHHPKFKDDLIYSKSH